MQGQASIPANVWLESWFRKLNTDQIAFFLFLYTHCDRVGWWNPDWDLVTARLRRTADNPFDHEKALEAFTGHVTVHASGWWQINGYLDMAYPNGLKVKKLNPSDKLNPMHVHAYKLMKAHFKREQACGEAPGPVPTGDLDLDIQHEGPGQSLSRASAGPTQGLKVIGDGAGDGEGVEPQVLGSGGVQGGGEALPPLSPLVTVLVMDATASAFSRAGHPLCDRPQWAVDALFAYAQAHRITRLGEALDAYLAAKGRVGGYTLGGYVKFLPAWLAKPAPPPAACPHPSKRYWWAKADDFPMGMRKHMWACNACQAYGEIIGEASLTPHAHEWGEVIHGQCMVRPLDPAEGDNRLIKAQAYRACQLCPERREALVPAGVRS